MKTNQILQTELAERIKKGEATAFELLFKMYYSPLTRYALVLVRNNETSCEIVQETFLKIWETRTTIDPEKSIKSFLYRCVHNSCINFLKKTQVNLKLKEEYRLEMAINEELWEELDTEKLLNLLNEEKKMEALNSAIDHLPTQCREIFILCRFENYSYQQIADKLNISENTVKTQLQRAMAKLKEEIK